jgi:1,4-dihydroxy-2-naphthoyl-CoA hydrolase
VPITSEEKRFFQERFRGTMLELIGLQPIEVSKERVVAEIPYRDDLRQPAGMIHAGAILTLADTAATMLSNQNTQPGFGKFDPSRFSTTIQLNANFVRNKMTSRIVAEAVPVHIGRRTLVIQTTVRDNDGRLFASVSTTMIVAGAA